jgi:hypothetical protein
LASAGWKRKERISQEQAWAEMGEALTINKIKSNRREHYVPYLFQPLAFSGNSTLNGPDDRRREDVGQEKHR